MAGEERARPRDLPPAGTAARELDRRLARVLLEAIGRPPVVFVLWDGSEISAGGGARVGRVVFRRRSALLDCLLRRDLGFGEAYADGRIEVAGELRRVLEAVFRSHPSRDGWRSGAGRWPLRIRRRNSVRASRRHIHRHYDLGNDFYRLWLDERMVYTCAYFPTPEVSLEEAQLAKLDLVCRKLRLRPGEEVVEAGCGWGALALHMARHWGVRVTACNVSEEQVRFARERARSEGLADRVRFVADDYRNLRGSFDVFVSIGMLEHVGRENYASLGGVIERCLSRGGRGLVHSIGRARPAPMSDWLSKIIFPGAYIPALREVLGVLEPFDFAVLDVENLRPHYAKTLEHWLERFEKAIPEVERRFDERFARTWRLYLVSSLVAFSTGSCQLYQVLFSRHDAERMPWTRADLCSPAGTEGAARDPRAARSSRGAL